MNAAKLDLPHHCRQGHLLAYDYWAYADDGKWMVSSRLETGDYVDSYARSNARVWGRNFADGEGTWWRWHGQSIQSIAIRTLAYRNSTDVRKALDALADYPLLDDSDHSDLEHEDEQENWESWARSDFRRELVRVLASELSARGVEGDASDLIEAVSDVQVDALFWSLCQQEESHPEHSGGEVNFPLVDMADAWDGLVPSLGEDGKPGYHTGDIATWEPVVVGVVPECVRCSCDCPREKDDSYTHGLWYADCGNAVCDIPVVGESPEAKLAFEALLGDEGSLAVLQDAIEGKGDTGLAHALRGGHSSIREALKKIVGGGES